MCIRDSTHTVSTPVLIEKAYQVGVETPTGTVSFSAMDKVDIYWSPASIFPKTNSSNFQVAIDMYGLNLQNGEWELIHTFDSNSANDGQEMVLIPGDLDHNLEILPVAFRVSASVNPARMVQSGTLYTKLVVSGQQAGRWSSQFYYVNPLVANQTGYHLCQSWYEAEPRNVGAQLIKESTPCPPREIQARAPNSGMVEISYTSFFGNSSYRMQWLRSFHQEASTCFSTRNPQR